MRNARVALVASCLGVVVLATHIARAQSPEFHYLHGGQYEGVIFIDSQDGWVSGDGGRIRYTQDGGATWTTAKLTEDEDVPSVRSCAACTS